MYVHDMKLFVEKNFFSDGYVTLITGIDETVVKEKHLKLNFIYYVCQPPAISTVFPGYRIL